ncbi:HAMP domain-containing sensor histidine kinase [Paractinoplanes durhamensis]|uniref:histidine kinase n=1 Tax=Paractinoplanes durhamensis TaxID=113563 RepID=A0ABQ3Z9T4_9ACTN|nr:histidine kinase dimerization/phospho-acceptor domain-containing protein [Actinoplanes durhamensis]GIE06608.1 two-component sensor histidine kinase [Actinoplanes durhamensis]
MRDFLRTLTGRVMLVTAATAVVAVIVTALVAVPVSIRAVNTQVRAELVEQSKLAVELLATERPAARETIVTELRAQDVEVYLIRRGTVDRTGLPSRVVQQIAAGQTVDTRSPVNGRPSFIVGRPLSGRNAGVVLTRPVASGTAGKVLGRIWIALLAGLAGGIGAGALLARFIARPIRRAAAAAGKLSAGDRSVRISRQGPAEAGELADAINHLATALQISEGRERDFLLSVSHELRTPLATIRGYAEALADGVVGADGAEKAGATMLAESERLDRLISDLLVLSRLEAADLPLDVVPVDLAELVRAAGEAWAARCAPDGPRLRVELPPEPLLVETDPGRIRQVLDGLCENALRVVPAKAPLVLAARAGAEAAVLEVRDGGPGFTDEDLEVAFERGALNRRYRGIRKVGSGLGLALAARLVGRLGGRISAGHAPEGGALFTVELPYPARTLP